MPSEHPAFFNQVPEACCFAYRFLNASYTQEKKNTIK